MLIEKVSREQFDEILLYYIEIAKLKIKEQNENYVVFYQPDLMIEIFAIQRS